MNGTTVAVGGCGAMTALPGSGAHSPACRRVVTVKRFQALIVATAALGIA
jgi:hypothetical protein